MNTKTKTKIVQLIQRKQLNTISMRLLMEDYLSFIRDGQYQKF